MSKSLENRKKCVLRYIKYQDTTILVFCNKQRKIISELKEYKFDNINNLVIKVLDLSYHFYSRKLVDKRFTCSYDKRRSSLDIYRHCKYFKRDITIFDVMNSLYSIGSPILYTIFCGNIMRRVFKLQKNHYYIHFDNLDLKDEYDLKFSEWNGIND